MNLSNPITRVSELKPFYQGRPVLVAGADGFLGANLVYALLAAGAEVSILSRRPTPRVSEVNGRVFQGDLQNHELMRSVVQGQSIVFDLAGVSGATESNQDPSRDLDLNCSAQLSLLLACAHVPQPPLVMFPSSRLVYGKPQFLPVNEEHPLLPQSFYAAHKITVENYLRVLAQTRGLPFCILRLSNPYGPFQPLEARSYGIVNEFVRMAAEGEPIRIFGDGAQIRDYIYVDEVSAVFMLCAQNPACWGETFNLGGRSKIRMVDAANEIARLAGGRPVRHVPWPESHRSVETGDYCSDLSKLARFIPLPEPVSFEEGIRCTLDYYRKTRCEALVESAQTRPRA
jgi:UDP-glucose 4-epimerase